VSFTDLAAVVGALAWIPPIFVGIRAWITRPEIRIITQPAPEIGFTTFGPILNIRIALTVRHKDIVITGVRLQVRHESGEESVFSWRGIVQRMGTFNYPQIGAVPFEKESSVLAMKVSPKDVEERFIRFQNLEYLEQKLVLDGVSLKKLAYLRKSDSFDGPSFLKSSEMADVYSYIRQSFSWKPGSYRVKVMLDSPDAFVVIDDEYAFTLSPLQTQNLSDNLNYIEQYFANEVLPMEEGEQRAPINWSWAYPDMQRISG
jgi:hypothetical protein